MRVILLSEIKKEMPNGSALGAFTSAISGAMAFGTPSKSSSVNKIASNRLFKQASIFDNKAKSANNVKQMTTYQLLANKRRQYASKIAKGR